jgi:hypothetical protein
LIDEFEELQQMLPTYRGFISANPELPVPKLSSTNIELVEDVFGRVEFAYGFRAVAGSPAPAENTAQTTAAAIGGGYATIPPARPSGSIVLPEAAFSYDDFFSVLGELHGVKKLHGFHSHVKLC